MRVMFQNGSHTVGIGEIEEGDRYTEHAIVGLPALKEAIKIASLFEGEDYRVGFLEGEGGDKILVLKPNTKGDSAILVAERIEVEDPEQQKITGNEETKEGPECREL